MSERLPLELERFPLHPEIVGEEAVRQWLLDDVEHAVFTIGRVPSRIALVGDGWVELAVLDRVLEHGPGLAAAVLKHPQLRPGVKYRFRTGELDATMGRGVAVGLQLSDDGSWWLATRPFANQVFTGPWQRSEGRGFDELPPRFHAWVDAAGSEIQSVVERPTRPTRLRGYVSAAEPWPTALAALAKIVAAPSEAAWLSGEEVGVSVVACREGVREHWEILGDIPSNLSDVIRAIGQDGEPAEALALLHLGLIKQGEHNKPALVTLVERDGRRATRAFVLSEDRSKVEAVLFSENGDIDAGERWVGVAPLEDPGLITKRASTPMGEGGEA